MLYIYVLTVFVAHEGINSLLKQFTSTIIEYRPHIVFYNAYTFNKFMRMCFLLYVNTN